MYIHYNNTTIFSQQCNSITTTLQFFFQQCNSITTTLQFFSQQSNSITTTLVRYHQKEPIFGSFRHVAINIAHLCSTTSSPNSPRLRSTTSPELKAATCLPLNVVSCYTKCAADSQSPSLGLKAPAFLADSDTIPLVPKKLQRGVPSPNKEKRLSLKTCLLYTSDAADE